MTGRADRCPNSLILPGNYQQPANVLEGSRESHLGCQSGALLSTPILRRIRTPSEDHLQERNPGYRV